MFRKIRRTIGAKLMWLAAKRTRMFYSPTLLRALLKWSAPYPILAKLTFRILHNIRSNVWLLDWLVQGERWGDT